MSAPTHPTCAEVLRLQDFTAISGYCRSLRVALDISEHLEASVKEVAFLEPRFLSLVIMSKTVPMSSIRVVAIISRKTFFLGQLRYTNNVNSPKMILVQC